MIHFTADSISMWFGRQRILSDVYIEAHAGEIIGVLGRNGSGKSTLYKCLLGLFGSSTGALRIDGRLIPKKDAPRYLAYLPQDSYLPRDIRLQKSVDLILGRRGIRDLIKEDARASSLMQQKARSLSVGEVRYVECLIALSLNRPLLLLDEPFSQIEPMYCEVLEKHIRETAVNRVTMISDHLYRNVQRTASRISVMEGGSLWHTENSLESLRKYGYLS